MKSVVVLIVLLASCSLASAEDCKSIQDAPARLACFDKVPATPKAPKAAAAPKAPPATSAKGSPGSLVDSGWELKIKKDGFTDQTTCVISPIGRPWVQISVGNLYISYQGRGGVAGFTMRLDDSGPEPMRLPSPTDKSVGLVHLGGEEFFSIMAANRLRVQTFTVLQELKDEDLSLAGARRLYQKMPPVCGT
jgi:hypothetical protein